MTSWLILAVAMAAQQGPEFHQNADYVIEAVLDTNTHVLKARERIKYRNNSRQNIDTLWFHLHLNAFRPNSAWAQRELQFGNRRFQDLGPDDHAFERVSAVRVGVQLVRPIYPHAPDSTVMAVPLPETLPNNSSIGVTIDWSARLSTLPRRQGRRGSHYDFAQWYPRIAAFDKGGWQVQPLLPQGEFYGEFATYEVTMEVPKSFVIAATGVPMEGNPGWEEANIDKSKEVRHNRSVYGPKAVDGLYHFDRKMKNTNKRVRWRAERVHHFAWSANPDYKYEGGMHGKIPIHAFFLPTDTTWAGRAIERTAKAMAFMESIFGPYPWPQISNVHRVEGGGGTEFPMMIMDASADEGLIVHEIAHQWAHGILANNEWREGWLDEGMASFLGSWYVEESGRRPNYGPATQGVARMDTLTGMLPIGTPSAAFKDMNHYSAMTYTKPQFVFRMLRDYLGDAAFRAGMKLYYEKNKLQHVDEEDFKNAMEEASKKDLDWFFQQWIHTNNTLDYAVSAVSTAQQANGTWRTRVDVTRTGQAWMPVRLKVGDVVTNLDSRDTSFSVNVDTPNKPTEVVLDPDFILLDLDRQNNIKAISN
jgi:hypothetical protein